MHVLVMQRLVPSRKFSLLSGAPPDADSEYQTASGIGHNRLPQKRGETWKLKHTSSDLNAFACGSKTCSGSMNF